MPALLDLDLPLAIALGKALPSFRRTAAERIVREAAGLGRCGLRGAEPVPFVDIPLVLAAQIRMVLPCRRHLRRDARRGAGQGDHRRGHGWNAGPHGGAPTGCPPGPGRGLGRGRWRRRGRDLRARPALRLSTLPAARRWGQRQLRDLYRRALQMPPPAAPRSRQGARFGASCAICTAGCAASPRTTSPPSRRRMNHGPITLTSRHRTQLPPIHADEPAEAPAEPRRSSGRRRIGALYRRMRRKLPSTDLTRSP